jgi:hypothetical protein
MRFTRSTGLVCAALALLVGCRERTSAPQNLLAQASVPGARAPHDAGAGSGATVIIEIPATPVDARAVDYAAPLYLDPGASPGSAGNGKPVPRNMPATADAAPLP